MNQEKSQELADLINDIKMPLFFMDLEYAKEAMEQMMKQANWQDSAAVLNPSYNPDKSNLLRLQGSALNHLIKYVETLKEVDKMKEKISTHDVAIDKIKQMFV